MWGSPASYEKKFFIKTSMLLVYDFSIRERYEKNL